MTGFNVEDVFSLAAKELYNAKKETESGDVSSTPGGAAKKAQPTTGTSLEQAQKKGENKKGGCC